LANWCVARLADINPMRQRSALDLRAAAEDAAALFPALMIEAERVASQASIGAHGRRRAGTGDQFFQHRPYAFGDAVSAIDWRQSARASDRLYVRQNEWETAAAVWIWRDTSSSLDYSSSQQTPTKRRRADVLALALCILLSEGGERIGLVGENARGFHGRTAPARFLEAMITQSPAASESAPPNFPVPPHATVVFISDFFTDVDSVGAAAARCASLGARGAMLQIVDRAEEEFPFDGRTEFKDLESPARLMIGDAGKIARDYREAFVAHRASLAAVGARIGWPVLNQRTDEPAPRGLMRLVDALSDKRYRAG
jgi:uncharacterized protein (DUF58 family)